MKTVEERFWDKVDVRGDVECWPWKAGSSNTGYGVFDINDKQHGAHRVAFFLKHGRWPNICRHACDNKACCNPAHLEDGTYLENNRDRQERGGYACGENHWSRRNPEKLRRGQEHWSASRPECVARGEDNGGSKLKVSAVSEIRALHGKVSQRQCAAMYGISKSQVANIWNGRQWKGAA